MGAPCRSIPLRQARSRSASLGSGSSPRSPTSESQFPGSTTCSAVSAAAPSSAGKATFSRRCPGSIPFHHDGPSATRSPETHACARCPNRGTTGQCHDATASTPATATGSATPITTASTAQADDPSSPPHVTEPHTAPRTNEHAHADHFQCSPGPARELSIHVPANRTTGATSFCASACANASFSAHAATFPRQRAGHSTCPATNRSPATAISTGSGSCNSACSCRASSSSNSRTCSHRDTASDNCRTSASGRSQRRTCGWGSDQIDRAHTPVHGPNVCQYDQAIGTHTDRCQRPRAGQQTRNTPTSGKTSIRRATSTCE